MAASVYGKLMLRRLLLSSRRRMLPLSAPLLLRLPSSVAPPAPPRRISRPFFSSRPSCSEVPAAIDYSSTMAEEEFHRLADATIHDFLEKLEEYGDSLQIDGFDIDYGNHVLTLKLGDLGTYVINKQTPNRQIWLSSPVSGPSRFDWDATASAWVYRRTKSNLRQLLEEELQKLCGEPIDLS